MGFWDLMYQELDLHKAWVHRRCEEKREISGRSGCTVRKEYCLASGILGDIGAQNAPPPAFSWWGSLCKLHQCSLPAGGQPIKSTIKRLEAGRKREARVFLCLQGGLFGEKAVTPAVAELCYFLACSSSQWVAVVTSWLSRLPGAF